MTEEKTQGLVILNTGNGKGKTPAAFGLVLRPVGFAVAEIRSARLPTMGR